MQLKPTVCVNNTLFHMNACWHATNVAGWSDFDCFSASTLKSCNVSICRDVWLILTEMMETDFRYTLQCFIVLYLFSLRSCRLSKGSIIHWLVCSPPSRFTLVASHFRSTHCIDRHHSTLCYPHHSPDAVSLACDGCHARSTSSAVQWSARIQRNQLRRCYYY